MEIDSQSDLSDLKGNLETPKVLVLVDLTFFEGILWSNNSEENSWKTPTSPVSLISLIFKLGVMASGEVPECNMDVYSN